MINSTSNPNSISYKPRAVFPHKVLDEKSREYSTFLKIVSELEYIGNEKTNSKFDWAKSFDIPDESNSQANKFKF